MEEQFSQYEKYLGNELAEHERRDFEQKLATDKAFKQEFVVYRDMLGGIRLRSNQQLKQKLESIHQTEFENQLDLKSLRSALL